MRKENRATFFARIKPLFSPRDAAFIEIAYVLVKDAFRPYCRKGEKDPSTGAAVRSFEHPRRVALILLDEVCCAEADVIIAGLLHDGDEDTRLLKVPMIEFVFGPEIARIVRMLSKQEFADGSKDVGYADRLKNFGDWKELLIKACDRLDNLRTLGDCGDAFILKQITETKEKYYPMLDLMSVRVPERYRDRADGIRFKIKTLVSEYERQLEERRPD